MSYTRYFHWTGKLQSISQRELIRFDSIRFDSIRFDSIRFDSIRLDSIGGLLKHAIIIRGRIILVLVGFRFRQEKCPYQFWPGVRTQI
jgi:hypothetical protein